MTLIKPALLALPLLALGACATIGPPAATASGAASTNSVALGSIKNPVRVAGPAGERAYLDTLRCTDGTAPAYMRRGSGDGAPDGHIVDFYDLRCGDEGPVQIVMDMYHERAETRPVPGFTIGGKAGGTV